MWRCKTVFYVSCLFVVCLFCTSSQAASGIIKDVTFQENGSGSDSVIFHLDGPSLPTSFALKGEHPRVVFDFKETQLSGTVPSVIPVNGRIVDKIRMGRHSDKTRVVIDLAFLGAVDFDQRFDEELNILTIQIYSTEYPAKEEEKGVELAEAPVVPVAEVEETELAEAVVETPVQDDVPDTVPANDTRETKVISPPVSENPLTPEPLLDSVSFENTSNRGEMVLFKLNGFYPPEVSGEEKGVPKVSCIFSGTRLGPEVVAEQDVGGEYIDKITVSTEEGSDQISVILELIPNKNYDLQQVFFKEDNLFVIIINSYDAMAAPGTE